MMARSARSSRLSHLAATALAFAAAGAGLAGLAPTAGAAGPAIEDFRLANGMQVVVIPDRRVPVVTHMVWYRVGAAEDPPGKSGLAHLLEHMMFKATRKLKAGELSRIVTGLGGIDNATTTHDATFYFQRVASDRLEAVMALEADRMVNIVVTEAEVKVERDVVREERRQSVESDPISELSEQMMALLHPSHPYKVPAIGWAHEIVALDQADAAAFYARHYAPNNAILVVAGDASADEVRRLAEASYGKLAPNPAIQERVRAGDPPPIAARRILMSDPRAGPPTIFRSYLAPSHASAAPGEAASLEVLAHILGSGDSSRLHRKLVGEARVAAVAGAMYFGAMRDSGRLTVLAVALGPVETVEAAIDAVLMDLRETGVTASELERAKSALEARSVYDSDNQTTLARRIGEGLVAGRSLAGILADPARIEAVTADDVKAVAARVLDARRSVTGILTRGPAGTTLSSGR